MTADRIWEVTWETGPDAGASIVAPADRYVVGRAPQATLRCDDDTLEPFQVQLDLTGDAPVVRQLAGRLPVHCERRSRRAARPMSGASVWVPA